MASIEAETLTLPRDINSCGAPAAPRHKKRQTNIAGLAPVQSPG